jgi:hypothetical protein
MSEHTTGTPYLPYGRLCTLSDFRNTLRLHNIVDRFPVAGIILGRVIRVFLSNVQPHKAPLAV